MDSLSLGKLAPATLLMLATATVAQADIVLAYPSLNKTNIYPSIVCETKQAILDISKWSKNHFENKIALDQLEVNMLKYADICKSNLHQLNLTKEINRYTGISMDNDIIEFGVFETINPNKFAIIAIGKPE